MSSLHYHEPTTSNQYESRRKLVANLLHTYELICTGSSGRNFRGRGWPHRYNNNNNNSNNNKIIIIIIIITDLCSAFRSEDTEALKDTEALVRFYHYRNTI